LITAKPPAAGVDETLACVPVRCNCRACQAPPGGIRRAGGGAFTIETRARCAAARVGRRHGVAAAARSHPVEIERGNPLLESAAFRPPPATAVATIEDHDLE